jgi:hypothetical protein
MSRVLKTSGLISTVRRRAMIPDDSSTFTDEDILDILNEEIDVGLLPTLMSLNEEHMVVFEDTDTSTDTQRYTIPYRAVANKLRDVAYLDGSGAVYELSRVSLEELSDYRYYRSSSKDDVFYVEGNEIVLVDTTLKNYEKIRQYFYLRPNKLVEEKLCGEILSIDRTNGIITLVNFPEDFTNLNNMDFIQARTPNKIIKYDVTPLSADRNTKAVTFDAENIPSSLRVGDFLCNAEESPVANVPTELHPVLAQRAAVHILESLGDTEGLANALRKLDQMEKSVMQIIDDRVEGAPQKIKPRHSTLRSAVSRRARYRTKF